jgi:hypothetical protein
MGYTFTCDDCHRGFDHAPPFMGELSERFLKTADSPLVDHYQPGETVTLCRDCSEAILL